MSAYDKEYFFSFDDYQKSEKNQPIPLFSWNENKFDFYEMRFKNNVVIYLFNTLKETIEFRNYCNLPNVPFTGEINDVTDRVIFESINRNTKDFCDLCNQLAEERKYCFIYVPFKLSWQQK